MLFCNFQYWTSWACCCNILCSLLMAIYFLLIQTLDFSVVYFVNHLSVKQKILPNSLALGTSSKHLAVADTTGKFQSILWWDVFLYLLGSFNSYQKPFCLNINFWFLMTLVDRYLDLGDCWEILNPFHDRNLQCLIHCWHNLCLWIINSLHSSHSNTVGL